MGNNQVIGIRELIERVRQELLAEHEDVNPLFIVGHVELEISFTVERNLSGGINLQVVQAGVDKTTTDVQTVKVGLEPILTVDELREEISWEQKVNARRGLTQRSPPGDRIR